MLALLEVKVSFLQVLFCTTHFTPQHVDKATKGHTRMDVTVASTKLTRTSVPSSWILHSVNAYVVGQDTAMHSD